MAKPETQATEELKAAAKAAGVDFPSLLEEEEGVEEPEIPEGEAKGEEETKPPEKPEPLAESEEDEIPDEYFGVKLSDIEDSEARKEVYDQLQTANRVANRRLQEIADLRKEAEVEAARERAKSRIEPPAEEEPEELDDEELLKLAGLDPRILEYEDFGKPVAQLVRKVLEVDNRLDKVTKDSELANWERQFYSDLDVLQREHGEIPYDRGTIEEFAMERQIFHPEALYNAIMAPIWRELATNPAPASKQENPEMRKLKRKVSGTKRRNTAAPTVPKKPQNLQEAFEAAKIHHGETEGDPFSIE